MEGTATVFMDGGGQAVRMPRRFRIDGKLLAVSRRGSSIVLTPLPKSSWDDFFANHVCPDFMIDRAEAQRLPEETPFA